MSHNSKIDAITKYILWRQYKPINTKVYKLSTSARVFIPTKPLKIIHIYFPKSKKKLFCALNRECVLFLFFWGISPSVAPHDAGRQLKRR